MGRALYERADVQGFLEGKAAAERPGSFQARAVAALGRAASLDPHDVGSRHRLGTLLRRDKKRLREAMLQFQTVLRIDRTHAEAKQALDEVVEEHRKLNDPKRTWRTMAYQLGSMAVVVWTALYFQRHEMRSPGN